jgi:hypothetical protein
MAPEKHGRDTGKLTLTEIFDKYSSDKGTGVYLAESALGPGFIGHRYSDRYPLYLESLRETNVSVLELGVEYGASVRGWRDYFGANAEIIGFDLDVSRAGYQDLDQITLIQGDQGDDAALRSLSERGPFDVVVDDAGHIPALQISTFQKLFPVVKPGGIYIVEDIQTQHFPMFGPSTIVTDFFSNLALHIQANGTAWHSAHFPEHVWTSLDEWQKLVDFVHFWRYMVVIGRSSRI